MTQYLYDLTDTWDNAGTTFDAIKINVTNTNSATASKLIDLQVGTVSKFKVLRDGDVTLTGPITGATSITGSGTFTADRLTVTKTVANAPAISSTGYTLSGTDTSSLVDLAGSWGSTSAAPTAFKLNITDSSSPNSASLLMDLQRGGTSQFSVSKAGLVRGNFYYALAESSGLWAPGFGVNYIVSSGVSVVGFSSNNATGGVSIKNNLPLTWATDPLQTGVDLFLWRDGAANTLAQRNAANAQTFNIYNTFSSSTSYERLSIICQSNDSVLIRTNKGSGGGSARALVLGTDGTAALTLTTAQKAEFASTIKTAAPAGGTAAEWKLGTVASVTPTSPDRTIEVDIGGTIYYIHAKTTNN